MTELIVLGSGTAVPSETRSPAGYFLAGPELDLLIDSGPGTLGRLARAGVPLERVRRAFYTHFHPDHTLDLMALVFALKNPRFHPGYERLTVYGPEGITDFYEGMKRLYGNCVVPETYELDLEVMPRRLELGCCTIQTRKMLHTDRSIGYRFETGTAIVAYSGDTDFCEEAIELGRDADLFILECALPEGSHVPGHLTPSLAGKIAAGAGCKRLLLTHFYPECEGADLLGPCREEFDGEVLLATDGMRLPLP